MEVGGGGTRARMRAPWRRTGRVEAKKKAGWRRIIPGNDKKAMHAGSPNRQKRIGEKTTKNNSKRQNERGGEAMSHAGQKLMSDERKQHEKDKIQTNQEQERASQRVGKMEKGAAIARQFIHIVYQHQGERT